MCSKKAINYAGNFFSPPFDVCSFRFAEIKNYFLQSRMLNLPREEKNVNRQKIKIA